MPLHCFCACTSCHLWSVGRHVERLGSVQQSAAYYALNCLPAYVQILSSILCFLDDPSHAAAAALTCKRLRCLSKSAPLRLRIAPSRFMMEDNDGVETLRQDRLRVFLTGLCAQLKGEELTLTLASSLVARQTFVLAGGTPDVCEYVLMT